MQRHRWTDPGTWIEDNLHSDLHQISAKMQPIPFQGIQSNETHVKVNVLLTNTGLKPHRFWLVIDAKPSDASSWNKSTTTRLTAHPLFLGTGRLNRLVSITTEGPTTSPQNWDIRARLLSYSPTISEPEDQYGQVSVHDREFTGRITSLNQSISNSSLSPTPAPKSTTTSTPGFTLITSLSAFLFLIGGVLFYKTLQRRA